MLETLTCDTKGELLFGPDGEFPCLALDTLDFLCNIEVATEIFGTFMLLDFNVVEVVSGLTILDPPVDVGDIEFNIENLLDSESILLLLIELFEASSSLVMAEDSLIWSYAFDIGV